MLGELQVSAGAVETTKFRTAKTALLLVRLALSPGRSFTRDDLVDLLWPEADAEAGRVSLRQALSALRRVVEPPPFAPGSVLATDGGYVGLRPGAYSTDVLEFEQAVRASRAAEQHQTQVALLQQAVTLYTGDLLPASGEPWIVGERERLRNEAIAALLVLAAIDAQAGVHAAAIGHARRAVALDPLRESSCLALMNLCAACGDTDAALKEYRALERRLQKEVGERPSQETAEIAARLRGASQPVRRQASAESIVPLPLPPQVPVAQVAANESNGEAPSHPPPLLRAAPSSDLAPRRATRSHPAQRPLRSGALVAGVFAGGAIAALIWALTSSHWPHASAPVIRSASEAPFQQIARAVVSIPPIRRERPSSQTQRQSTRPPAGVAKRQDAPVRKSDLRSETRSAPAKSPAAPAAVHPRPERLLAAARADRSVAGARPKVSSAEREDAEWVSVYPNKRGDGDSEPTAAVLDPSGNLYVTGFIRTHDRDVDYLPLKYDPSGKIAWQTRYDGPSHDVDRARAIALDKEDCLYVTGESDSGQGNGPDRLAGLDIATVKYDRSGREVWVRRYDGPEHAKDTGCTVVVGANGDVYVAGRSWSADGQACDITVICYHPNGQARWARRFPCSATAGVADTKLCPAADTGVFLTGTFLDGSLVARLGAGGGTLWSRGLPDSSSGRYGPRCITAAPDGAIVIAGTVTVAQGAHAFAAEYGPDGAQRWRQTLDTVAGDATFFASAVSPDGEAFLAGEVVNVAFGRRALLATVSRDGSKLAVTSYHGHDPGFASARAVALNSNRHALLVGDADYTNGTERDTNFAIDHALFAVTYDDRFVPHRELRYPPRGICQETGKLLAIDSNDNAYAVGCHLTADGYRIAVIKYRR